MRMKVILVLSLKICEQEKSLSIAWLLRPEESARESAEGAVQEKSYKATFPILINLNDKPLYIMGLKDNAGLVKEYALVDAVEYQKRYRSYDSGRDAQQVRQ